MTASAHVFTVASGFGLRIVPVAAPYELASGPERHQLDVERRVGDTHLFARVTATDGGYTSQLGAGTGSLHDVVDIETGPAFTAWWLETSVYRIPLPNGWRAIADGVPDAPSRFDLVGPGGALIYVQTPKRIPASTAMVAPGQVLHDEGRDARSRWVDVRYRHDQHEWAQRHDVVELEGVTCVVTTQCPVAVVASVAGARDAVVSGIARTQR